MSKEEKDTETAILVGYVKKFDFNDKTAEEILQGHPIAGRIYQIIKDTKYGYRLHIGAENTKDNLMEGILLGEELKGDHDDKWNFDIELVGMDNFLEFDIHDDDTKKLQDWFSTGNKELLSTLSKPTKIVAQDKEGNLISGPSDSEETVHKELEVLMIDESMNAILDKDPEFFLVLARLITYLGAAYSSGLSKGELGLDSTEFLLNGKTSEPAIFTVTDCLQQYTNKHDSNYGNVGKVYQAIDYLMLELQRRKRKQTQND